MGGFSKSDKAISLIQLMIASVLVLGLGAVIFYASKGSRSGLQIQNEYQKLISVKNTIRETLNQDLSKAVRFTGSSQSGDISFALTDINNQPITINGLQGIYRLPDTTTFENDYIILLVDRFPGVVPTLKVSPSDELDYELNSSELDEFVQRAFERASLFYITNLENSDFVHKANWRATDTTLHLLAESAEDYIQGYNENSVRLGMLEAVVYLVDEENQLLRRTYRSLDLSPQNMQSEQIVANNIENFRIRYEFQNRREQGSQLKLPQRLLRHPFEYLTTQGCSGADCCNPSTESCVSFRDVAKVQVDADLKSKAKAPIQVASSNSNSLFSEDGYLQLSMTEVFIPLNYSESSAQAELVGDSFCPLSDPRTRCNPRCADKFQNETAWENGRRPLDWVGYKPGGAYCACCTDTDGNFTPCEQSKDHIPQWKKPGSTDYDPAENAQVEACGQVYNACDISNLWLRDRHPGLFLACRCMHEDDTRRIDHYDYDHSSGTWQLELEHDDLSHFNYFNDVDTRTGPENIMRCREWNYCDHKVEAFYGSSLSSAEPFPEPFKERCKCLTQELDLDGNTLEGTNNRIRGVSKHFQYLCNLDYMDSGDSDDIACPNTLATDASGDPIYRILDPTDPANDEGLYELDIAMCECYRKAYASSRTNNNGDTYITTPSEVIPRNDSVDFRLATSPSQSRIDIDQFTNAIDDPYLNDDRSNFPNTFGSTQTFTISSVTASTGASTTTTVDCSGLEGNCVCGEIYCASAHLGYIDNADTLGCATAPNFFQQEDPDKYAAVIAGLTSSPHNFTQDEAQAYAGYCWNNSSSGIWARDLNNARVSSERKLVRKELLNIDDTADFPSWCGGPQGGGSTGGDGDTDQTL